MTDRRLIPANGRVALRHLEGQAEADRYVDGELLQVAVKVANLWADENRTSLDRQLVFGDRFLVLESRSGMAFGQAGRDGYVGYVMVADLAEFAEPSHSVCVRATHLYPEPDMKTIPLTSLSLGSSLCVIGEIGGFWQTDTGAFVFKQHVKGLSDFESDAAGVAELFLGTPYLWGGNSCDGIDCSGLVQASLLACGIDCPGDSDMQLESVGETVGGNVATERGDLFFWKGHVAMALDSENLIHATAHSMSVVIENTERVVERIKSQGEGPLLARKRP